MHQGHYVFAPLMQHLPLTTFRRCVARYNGEYRIQQFSCLDQYLCLAFAQLVFLTNNFALDALTIAKLYKCRWQVELFFKWIKQHLRIKTFFSTSENAVKSQIWIAVSVYVLVAIVKNRLALPATLYEILQILSLTLFE